VEAICPKAWGSILADLLVATLQKIGWKLAVWQAEKGWSVKVLFYTYAY
jgi:hypothetical protein